MEDGSTPEWSKFTTVEGWTYYYNHVTGESTWELPDLYYSNQETENDSTISPHLISKSNNSHDDGTFSVSCFNLS